MLKIKILKVNNVNTVNARPAELIQSTKNDDISTVNMSKDNLFPRILLRHGESKRIPKVHFSNNDNRQHWSKPKVAYNE